MRAYFDPLSKSENMKTDNYITLVYKQLKGEISSDEAKALRTWESASVNNQQEAESIRRAWQQSEDYDLPFELDEQADFAKVQARLNPTGRTVQMPARRNNWLRIAAVGAILVIAGFAIRNYFTAETVTWAEMTASAEIQEFQLADGTKVWLNEGSTLSYPTEFSGAQRDVKLSGEAYFEVTKNAEKPFQIQTSETVVTVLGTAFNVKENGIDNLTEVAVTEGKVQVEAIKSSEKVILTVNEKAVYNHAENTLQEMTDETLNDTAWQRGLLKFKATSLAAALTDISHFYGVEIFLAEEKMSSCTLSGLFYTKKGLKTTLNDLAQQYKFEVEYSDDGKEVLLIGGNCQ